MSAAELAEWGAFDSISPLPDRRLDIHFAQLAATLLNGLGAKRQGGAPWTASDWLMFQPDKIAEAIDEDARRALVARTVLTQMRAYAARQRSSDER